MKNHKGLSRYRVHGRILLVLISLFFGTLLIGPMFRYLPVFLNLATAKQRQSSKIVNHKQTGGTRLDQTGNDFQNYLPLLAYNENQTSDHPSEQIIEYKIKENKFKAIDFSPVGSLITIHIIPIDNPLISNLPVEISFFPGNQCNFGDGQACIYEVSSPNLSSVTIASVHSGFGGEGENFRSLIEGTGINQGLLSTDQVNQNINALLGSEIKITQGTSVISRLSLVAIARIPPEHLGQYTALSIEETLEYAIEINRLDPEILNHNLFVLETCGWKLPNEPHIPGYSNTNYSVYLGFIQ